MRLIDADDFRSWLLKQKRLSKGYTLMILDEAPTIDPLKHAQQEMEKNEPLTREELQKMDGQPVWIEFIPDPDGQVKIWALVSVDPEDGEIFLLNSLGGASAYEEVWADIRAIYRHPPKEV